MSKNTKGIIFDLDDTLIDNEQFKDCSDKIFIFLLKKYNSVKKLKKLNIKIFIEKFISNYLKKKIAIY